jgi:hypothetical protein
MRPVWGANSVDSFFKLERSPIGIYAKNGDNPEIPKLLRTSDPTGYGCPLTTASPGVLI